jgi:hypothetical protein
VVDPQGARHIPLRAVQPHQLPVRRFPQRVGAQQLLGDPHRFAGIAVGFVQPGQLVQGGQLPGPEPVPLTEEPVIEATFQEITGVQLDGRPKRSLPRRGFPGRPRGEKLLELLDVEEVLTLGPPSQVAGGNLQVPRQTGKPLAQRVQHVT